MTVKRTHTYKDYDGKEVTEQLEFNLNRIELGKNLHLKDEFEAFDRDVIQGEKREMTSAETRKMFELIEELMRLTYGVRGGENNRKFIKTQEVWENFAQAAVYDSFIFWLFEDVERANDFMSGLMPAELRDAAAKLELEQQGKGAPIAPSEEEVSEDTSKVKRKVPTHEELLANWREKQDQLKAEEGTD